MLSFITEFRIPGMGEMIMIKVGLIPVTEPLIMLESMFTLTAAPMAKSMLISLSGALKGSLSIASHVPEKFAEMPFGEMDALGTASAWTFRSIGPLICRPAIERPLSIF